MGTQSERCHFCKGGDSAELDLGAAYARCKLANGNPCKFCSGAIKLDALISQARINLMDLLSQRQDLHREINRTHEPIIHHLPPEVSALIFFFSLSEDLPSSYLDKEKRYRSSRDLTTPLTLGAVCHTWRNIVWASPYLWTNISIPLKDRFDFGLIDIAREWLPRSGQLPLSIFIYTPQSPSQHDENPRNPLSEFLQLCLSRCRRLEFTCSIEFVPSFSGDAPLLEEIKIASNERIGKNGARRIILHSTKPEGLRLSVSEFNLNSLELPFAQVHEFEGVVSLYQCLSTFRKSPNLLECRIRGFSQDEDEDDEDETFISGPPITHNRLKKLTLFPAHRFHRRSSVLLDAVNLPALTHLTAIQVTPTSIHRFVLRSYCNLRYLRLESSYCEDGELCDMLRSTQSLQELHIIADRVLSDFHGDTFFKALAQAPLVTNPECLLPNLSVLTIKFHEEVGFPWDLASKIFGSLDDLRDPLRRPLTQFQVIYDWEIGHFASVEPEKPGFVNLLGLSSLFLDENATRRFLDIAHQGVNIKLYDVHANDDILRVAMSCHNISVPEWYQIEESFSDSDLEILHCSSDNLEQEPELTDSEDDSEESDEDLDSQESDDVSLDPEMGSDVSDDSDLWYDPDYGLPSNVTGATLDML